MKFDYMIMNPPFREGSRIIQKTQKIAKKEIVLAPLNCFLQRDNYKHLENFERRQNNPFDAYITPNLGIGFINSSFNNSKDLDEWKLITYDSNFLPVYKYIQTHTPTYIGYLRGAKKFHKSLNINTKTWFKVTHQAVVDGIHITDPCNDRNWNLYNKDILEEDGSNCIWYNMGTELARKNIIYWWYYKGKKGLANALLKGLHKSLTTNKEMMLPIDWNTNNIYTDEYVLSQMNLKFKNPENILEGVIEISKDKENN